MDEIGWILYNFVNIEYYNNIIVIENIWQL